MKNKFKGNKVLHISLLALIITLITSVIGTIFFLQAKKERFISSLSPENQRAINYEQCQDGDEAVDGTNNVKFNAFFLRDINGDGYAEKLKGTCKEIGKEDTLYMELIVQTGGHLENGKVEINGQNFYLQTVLPKDNELKSSYISSNTKIIEFDSLNNGIQKLLTGIVKSGDYTYESTRYDAIGNNINNYTRNDNKIVFTGTFIPDGGEPIEISKEIFLTVDWYGTTNAAIYSGIGFTNSTQIYSDISKRINEQDSKFTIDFKVNTEETKKELNLYSNYVDGTLPELNGYAPIEAKLLEGGGNFSYDGETRKFTILKTAETDLEGNIVNSISRKNSYKVQAIYPIEAYQAIGEDSVTIKIPVSTYYEGYNNQNTEFSNPYKSNIAETTIVATYQNPKGNVANIDIKVGEYKSDPYKKYIVSKRKPLRIYNGMSSEESDDTYLVKWYAYTGTDGESTGLTLKENKNNEETNHDEFVKINSSKESMEDITKNIGIYFTNADTFLKEDGEIKVYDADTGVLIETFTKANWNKYNSSNPYKYATPVKHIKVVTSSTNKNAGIYIFNIKELDDEVITSKYTKNEFDQLQYIQSNLVGYIGNDYIAKRTHQAEYVAPYSIAEISLSKDIITTQVTEKNMNIYLTTTANENNNQIGWVNGSFLVKLPEEILDIKINDVTIDNSSVSIESSELIENENGRFIKINTSNSNPASYKITINADITPDPRVATVTKNIELYASNEEAEEYYYNSQDIYDVNNNLNTEEKINKTETSINLVSPSSLLTNQTASNFDSEETIIVSPQIADLTPIYGETTKNTVKIGVQVKNNYASTISEVLLLGKIPFEGNTYVLSGGNLNSEFTTTMTNAGIQIPDNLVNKVTVYYSENESPNKNIEDVSNGWKTSEQVTDWSKIKTYIIDFGDTIIDKGDEYTFYYTLEIPKGLEFNKVAYSHHGIYFSLDTAEGKYRTSTEPNKIGIRIAEKFNLELTKYQTGKNKLVPGATYRISKLSDNGEVEDTSTAVTNSQGKLEIGNLYAEKVYEIKEIKSPEDYGLNENTVKIIGHIDMATGTLTAEKLEGTIKDNIQVIKEQNEDYKVSVKVEDEAKLKLQLTKYEKNTTNKLAKVRYKVTGEGLPESGKIITTNTNGIATLNALEIGQEYTLEEVKAEGYYLANSVKFKVTNNNGTYTPEIIHGEAKSSTVSLDNEIPTINLELEDDKIPTYTLNINKIEKGTGVNEVPVVKLEGAKFKLYKGTQEIGEYTTDNNGKIVIENLYQYEEERQLDQTYTLKETFAPEGYAKTSDITFKVEKQEGTLKLLSDETSNYTVDGSTVKLTIEDSPSFKLIKKDGETNALLPNVKFAIYNVDEGEVPAKNSKGEIIGIKETINGKEYYTVTTNSRGEITADLPEGLYKAVEVQADEKYDIKNKVKNFGIGKSREGKKAMQAEWAKAVGGSEEDQINSVISTSDGGYLVGGYFKSSNIDLGNNIVLNNSGSNDGMIIKYNAEKEVEWARSYGGENHDEVNTIIELSNGGYLVGGISSRGTIDLGNNVTIVNSNNNGILIKYNSEGETEWAKSIGGYNEDIIKVLIETKDNGYLVGGYFSSPYINLGNNIIINNSGYNDGMLIKFSNNGETEWAKSIGGEAGDEIISITQTKDDGYLVGGYFRSNSIELDNGTSIHNKNNDSSYDGMVIKYSSNGQMKWAKSIGGTDNDYISYLIETKDEDYIIGGYFNSSTIDLENNISISKESGNSYNGILIRYNKEGEIKCASSIGGTSYVNFMEKTSDGGYIVGGTFYGEKLDLGNNIILNSYGSSDAMIIKYNSNDEIEWANNFGGVDTESIKTIIENAAGEYIIGGFFKSSNVNLGNDITINSNGNTDGMIIKFKEIEVPDPVVRMAKGIGGLSNESVNSIIETSDGGYLVGGKSESNNVNLGNNVTINKGGMLIKYDALGTVEWSKQIGTSGNNEITSVIETLDGGYVAVGDIYTSVDFGNNIKINTKGSYDGIIIKFKNNGDVEWAKGICGTSNEMINSAIETSDGGLIVAGNYSTAYLDLGNNVSLSNNGQDDGMIIKLNIDGEVEWAKSVGGNSYDYLESLTLTKDGGFIVGGYFDSDNINLENNLTISNNGRTDGIIIKYNNVGEIEWAKSMGGTDSDRIKSVLATTDGGCLIGGYFWSYTIDLDDNITINKNSNNDAIIIKYNSEGRIEWAKTISGNNNEYITSLSATKDGGFIAGGYFNTSSIGLENNTSICNNGQEDGMIIKYSSKGNAEWAKSIGGDKNDSINSIVETLDGGYLVGGKFSLSSINLDNDLSLNNNGSTDGMILKIYAEMGVPEQQEVVVENNRKEYKITTDIKEIDNIKGGTISGEDAKPYEKVKYGETSTKEIKMIPDENYEIIGVTLNGKEYPYTTSSDGSLTMPQFTNMKEDKHIVVTYSLKDNKITINKKDSVSGQVLEGAKFKIDQIEEREAPTSSSIIGTLTNNGKEYTETIPSEEVTGKLGDLTNNGDYYFVNQDGKYVPTNSKTYQETNGGTGGVKNSIAWSYIPINLTGLTGKYVVVVNAEISSESSDPGVAFVTNSTTSPTYSSSTNRFININGTKAAKDYVSQAIEGENTYYLHLGYRKDGSTDYGTDQIIINSVKLYKANETTVTYNFTENEGKYESSNAGIDNTVSNSYIPINLSDYTGKYKLTVNASVSSENSDYGYATIKEDTTAPAYNSSQGQFIKISGTKEAADYVTELQAGRPYYLHLGYYKNTSNSSGDDKFTVNSINIELSDSDLYHTEVTTNSEGKGITQIPFGKYKITEIKAPEGYLLNTEPREIEFRGTEGAIHEFTIENQKLGKVTVHHYVKGSTTKVAEDDNLEGKIDESYKTLPHTDLNKYELEKDSTGKYVIPNNSIGTYQNENQEVIYYYVPKAIPLTVHHYIEGTENKVPLKNGNVAEDVISNGQENQNYTTSAISNELLADDYELVTTPENANGKYQYDEVEVTYYYKKVLRSMNLIKYAEDGTTPLGGATFSIKNNKDNSILGEFTTDDNGKIDVDLEAGTYTLKETHAPSTYKLDEAEKTIEIKRDTTTANINITNEKVKGTVTVHYYVEGTTTPIKLKNGENAENITKTGIIGDIYGTKPEENAADYYELVNENPEHASGEYIDGNIDVIYYYKLKDYGYRVEYYYDGVKDNLKTENNTANYGEKIENYTDKVIEGYVFDKTEGLPLTISTNPDNNIIKVYYVKRADLSYTVNYLEKGTNKVLKTAKVVNNKAFNDVIRAENEVEPISKYNYDSSDKETLTIGLDNSQNVINLYYTKKDASLVVKYVDEITNQEISTRDTITGKVDDEYTTTAKEIPNYVLTRDSGNTSGNLAEEETTVIYYYKHESAGVVVNHLDVNTNLSIADQETKSGKEGDSYTTHEKEIEGYDLVTDRYPENATGEMKKELITVNYYYVKKTKVTAKYIDKNSNKEIADQEVINGHENDPYTTETKNITNYVLVEEPVNKQGNMKAEPIEVIYYYVKISAGVVEKHIDEFTNELLDSETYQGNEGDEYTTSSKEFQGYELDNEKLPNNATGTMTTDPIEVKYYYKYKTSVNTKYVDKITGEEIVPSVLVTGYEGDEYQTEKKEYNENNEETLPFKDYTLTGMPENATGEMTKEPITVIYYYTHNSAGVTVKHIDVKTNEEIATQDKIKGHEGDDYTTHEKDIEGYDLVTERYPENATGKMKIEETEVKYYYIKKGKVTVKYIDKITGKELTDNVVINGHEGDDYETEEKTFDGYTLEKVPEDAKGKIEREDKVVKYYYVHNSAGVKVNHYDVITGEKLADEEIIDGHEGDNYETKEKSIEKYDLVKDRYPENAKGKMKIEETKVNYYYIQKAKVITKYVDKDTGEEISNKETIEGHEGEKYETKEKQIENYDIEKELYPNNSKGNMTKEDIEVIYYYKRKTDVITKYIDKEDGKEIEEKEETKGHIGEEYKTNAKDIKNYILIEEPKNKEGKMTKETTEVIYYYRKAIFNLSIDKQVKETQVNGKSKKINKDIAKVEVKRKKINDTNVKVVYTIKVTNDGEVAGNAKIEENIPKGMSMLEKDNKGWNIKKDKATITTNTIKPGESVNYNVVLTWDNLSQNFGTKKNVVNIVETKNDAGYKEKDTKDNTDDAQFIISVSTGVKTAIRAAEIATIVLSAIGVCIVVVKRRTKE